MRRSRRSSRNASVQPEQQPHQQAQRSIAGDLRGGGRGWHRRWVDDLGAAILQPREDPQRLGAVDQALTVGAGQLLSRHPGDLALHKVERLRDLRHLLGSLDGDEVVDVVVCDPGGEPRTGAGRRDERDASLALLRNADRAVNGCSGQADLPGGGRRRSTWEVSSWMFVAIIVGSSVGEVGMTCKPEACC